MAGGTQLGPYRIESVLGAGGMGEVYLARDTRLDRRVAVKISKEQFNERFEREARVVAALNHPNICSLYDVGPNYLVMELVEGPTLADRIKQGPIPLDESLAIARQIADALEAAHERGIVHRDLKPGNIKVRPDGTVKVLDFGLAKRGAPAGTPSSNPQDSPTITAATGVGVILGTAAYMSPEQARGHAVDKRADIWAFGVVLYEMLTGRQLFEGKTTSDVLAAVLRQEPDWALLPKVATAAVRRLLHRCLEKDPKLRLRDIGDARFEIDHGVDYEHTISSRTQRQNREYLAWGAAGLLLVASLAMLVSRLNREETPAARTIRTAIMLPRDVELVRTAVGHALAISPDGTRLAFIGAHGENSQLYLRDLSELESRAIPATSGAAHPFFSNDGAWVGFFAGGALWKVAVQHGSPLQICEASGRPNGATWGSDDTIVFATRGSGLFRVSARGGVPEPIAFSKDGAWPDILPDGKTILFTVGGTALSTTSVDGSDRHGLARRSDQPPHIGVPSDWTGLIKQAEPRLGAGFILQAKYLPTGHIVYGQHPGVIRAIGFDLASRQVKGSPKSVVDSAFTAPGAGAVYFAVSGSGMLAYVPENRRRQLAWVDRQGSSTPIVADQEAFRFPRLSPDAMRLAVTIDSEETRRADIWIYDLQRGTRFRLTGDHHNLYSVWTPDGKRIAFNRDAEAIAWQPADGTGVAEILHRGSPRAWSPHGRELLFMNSGPKTMADLWILASDATEVTRPLVATRSAEVDGRFSPDGRWITYVSDESGRFEIYAIRYPSGDGKTAVSTDGGTNPVWSKDGRELFYRRGQALVAVKVDTRRGFHTEPPRVLFDGSSFVGAGGDLSFDVAPDGHRFVMTKAVDAAASRQIVLVHNWFEELRRVSSDPR